MAINTEDIMDNLQLYNKVREVPKEAQKNNLWRTAKGQDRH